MTAHVKAVCPHWFGWCGLSFLPLRSDAKNEDRDSAFRGEVPVFKRLVVQLYLFCVDQGLRGLETIHAD